jgi:hypothetical protein
MSTRMFRLILTVALATAGLLGCGGSGGGSRGGKLGPPPNPFAVAALAAPLQQADLAGHWYGYERVTQYSGGASWGPSLIDAGLFFDAAGGPTLLDGYFFNVVPAVTIVDPATGRLRVTGADSNESRTYDVHVQEVQGRRTIRGIWTSSDGSSGTIETHHLTPLAAPLAASDLVGAWTGHVTRFGSSTATPIAFTVASNGAVTGGSFEGFALDGNSIGGVDARVAVASEGIASVSLRSDAQFPDGRSKYYNLDLLVDPQTRTARGYVSSEVVIEGRRVTFGDLGGYIQLAR